MDNKSNFIMLSYEKPRRKPSVSVSNMSEFAYELSKRIELNKLELAQTLGKYNGEEENSVMLKISADADKAVKVALELGKDLGQESILVRINDENKLIHCVTNEVMMQGNGLKFLDSDTLDDYTILNGKKFTLGLD